MKFDEVERSVVIENANRLKDKAVQVLGGVRE